MTDNLCRQYLEFLVFDDKNVWIGDEYLRVYIRKGRHLIDGQILSTIDIANVSNNEYDGTDEKLEFRYRQGHFRNFMLFVEQHNPYGIIYVESVISKRMEEILKKNGYVPSTHANCYHKFVGSYPLVTQGYLPDLVQDLGVDVNLGR